MKGPMHGATKLKQKLKLIVSHLPFIWGSAIFQPEISASAQEATFQESWTASSNLDSNRQHSVIPSEYQMRPPG